MSQVAQSITHSLSSSPPEPPRLTHILRQHHINKLHLDDQLQLHQQLKLGHTKSFSLDPTVSNTLPPPPKLSPKPNLNVDRPSPLHPPVSSYHFPILNLSSPTPPPADKTDYFDQFPPSHPHKPSPRPLHQKAQSETGMRLELPRSFPSSSGFDQIPMLRKKSGEVVRSSLKLGNSSPRPSISSSTYCSTRSAPSTPVCGPKAVHFDSHLEHVRHFLSQQRPMAVSRDGSPIETETEGEEEYPFPDMGYTADGTKRVLPSRTKLIIELLNMPLGERPPMAVCLKNIELGSDGKNLQGTVQVENLSFEKRVAVRFTFDEWQTVSEVTADYLSSDTPSKTRGNQRAVDLFGFTIKLQDVLARIEDREMEIAVRYRAAGEEFWDNNSGSNYHVRFKHLRLNNHPIQQQQPSQRQDASNPSQKSSLTNDPCPWAVTLRAELDRLVGDDLGVSMTNGIKKKVSTSTFGSPDTDGVTKVARLKCSTGLSARYDFSSSLKQATCNLKPKSDRFEEHSLPFPVSPLPIEWLGVLPISNNSIQGSNTPITTTATSTRRNSETNASKPYPSYNRWSLPGLVNLPNFPPSPPQDPPTTIHSSPTTTTTSTLLDSQVNVDLSPGSNNDNLNKLHFHHHCPSGLVTPHSPTLTDDSI